MPCPPPLPRCPSALPRGRLQCIAARARIILLLVALAVAGTVATAFDAAQLRQQLTARFGPARVALLDSWLQTIVDARDLGEPTKLKRINDFINRAIAFEDDRSIWARAITGRRRSKRSARGVATARILRSSSTSRCARPGSPATSCA